VAPLAVAPFWRRPGIARALRVLCVVVGFAGSLTALFFASLITLLSDCSGGLITFCTEYTGVVLVLQWALVIVAFAAPLAGGIASCARRQPWWLPAGLVTAGVLVWLTFVLEASQSRYPY